MSLNPSSFGDRGTPGTGVYGESVATDADRVLAALGSELITVDDLAKETGLVRAALGPPLRTLKDQGLVDLDVSGASPRWYATEGNGDGHAS